MIGWLWLLLASVFEIAFAASLKPSQGLTRPWPTASVVIFAVAAVVVLTMAVERLPLTTAYVAFVGLGTVGTTVVAALAFDEQLTAARLASIAVVLIGIAGLHLSST